MSHSFLSLFYRPVYLTSFWLDNQTGEFIPFTIFLDTIHRGGQAFVVALGLDHDGKKMPLGFWEGSSENPEICLELLADIERRGMVLSKRVLWVTDGGSGIIKALKERFGKKLIHQRCTIPH